MNADLQKLININKLEKQIEDLERQIQAHYKDVRKKQEEINESKKKQSLLESNISQIDNLILKSNEEVKVQNVELYNLKIKIKSKDIKSDKEIKNLSMDEDVINEKIANLKREIDIAEKKKIKFTNDIQELNILQEKITEEIQEIKAQADSSVSDLKHEQQETYNKHSNGILLISQGVLTFYEKIKKWAGTTSVVEIRKGACGGCFIKLSNKVSLEVANEDYITNCPHCGRILYTSK